jgi:biofilm PGA synthesis lipoprotein PgaB
MALLIRFLLLLIALPAFAQPAGGGFVALSYHEVENDSTPISSPTAVRASDLGAQFAWLKANAYQPVSIDAIVAARNGGQALPPKAVLLTFDDGLKDVYTRAFPLLKLFKYPAVIALVGTWLDVPAGQMVDYDNTPRPREQFVTWHEVREMQASGLIEVATHAYDLHHGILANPQGNTEPAAITRLYANGRYESDNDYLTRIRHDLSSSSQLIARQTGKAPRILVWPYGRSNLASQQIARELGMSITFTLEDGSTNAATPLIQTRRYLVENSPSLQEFAELMRRSWLPDPARSVRVTPGLWLNEEAELSATLDRLLSLQPNMAFVAPNAQRDGKDAALFVTNRRPLAADNLNRIGWQIERRAGVPVFIDLPDAWLGDSELIADLARQVNFAGFRLAAEPGSTVAQQARSAAERWRWPLNLVYSLTEAPAEAVWASLRPGDLIALPASSTNLAALPLSAKSQVLLEFDPALPALQIAEKMRQLEAAGFRQFGLSGFPTQGMDQIGPILSLRSQPQLK